MLNDKNYISFLLLDSKTIVVRHLMLQVLIALITSIVFLDREAGEISFGPNYMKGWVCYFVSMNIAMYVNLYILTPKLMLKDRLSRYITWAFVLATVLALVVNAAHFHFCPPTGYSHSEMVFFFFMCMFSSYVAYGMLVAGTSAFVLFQVWMRDNARMTELEANTLVSELKTLRNQINPHFLFNMLNNANVLLKRDAGKASFILLKLEGLLRYQFNSVCGKMVRLDSEITFMGDFLNLEKLRRDSFEYGIEVDGDVRNVFLPPLLFITFVENAVKHNPDSESFVRLQFRLDGQGFFFVCENSKSKNPEKRDVGGIGMTNIKRRLELLYPTTHSLVVEDSEDTYKVKLHIKL